MREPEVALHTRRGRAEEYDYRCKKGGCYADIL